jgi:DNA primase
MPLDWQEIVPKLNPQRFSVAMVPRYLATREQDPWRDMRKLRQSISMAARRSLGLAA